MKITNRKAYFEYSVIEEFSCGIKLLGNEVKSIRNGDITLNDSFVFLKNGEVFAKNMKVSKYKQAHMLDKHDENREKKLLLKRREIDKIEKLIQVVGTTIIPLEVFIFKDPSPIIVAPLWITSLYLPPKIAEHEEFFIELFAPPRITLLFEEV